MSNDGKSGSGALWWVMVIGFLLAFAGIGMVKEEVRNHRHVGDSVVVEVER